MNKFILGEFFKTQSDQNVQQAATNFYYFFGRENAPDEHRTP